MKLLVGLGNPGKKYQHNRHNIGFMVVDGIAAAHQLQPWRSRFRGETAEGRIGGCKCLLLKPSTYMNLSGESVREAAQFFKIPPEDIIVFHDEIDLAPLKVKVKTGGGSAGHNGLKSISAHVGNDYLRVRIGVGRPESRGDVAHYVLRDFAKADQTWLKELIAGCARHLPLLLDGEVDRFMSLLGNELAALPARAVDARKSEPQEAATSREGKASGKVTGTARPKGGGFKPDSGPMKAALEAWLRGKNPGQNGRTPPKNNGGES